MSLLASKSKDFDRDFPADPARHSKGHFGSVFAVVEEQYTAVATSAGLSVRRGKRGQRSKRTADA